MPRSAPSLLLVCSISALCLGPWACYSDVTPNGDHPPGDAAHEADAGAEGTDRYFAGLEKLGERGLVKVQLSKSDPIPQDTGLYTWTLTLLDLNDSPISDATLRAEPTMQAHGHGTFPPFTQAIPLASPGQYQLADLDLFMAGVWKVAITVELPDGEQDALAFYFYLEG